VSAAGRERTARARRRVVPAAGRRSHAERTAETRARIVAAVVESIAEVGFPRTTAAEVTRRAGVTWGAVQHHFGGKDGMLMAVLEDSFRRFEARLAGLPIEHMPLAERVSVFVERAWAHFASREYASTAEILRDSARRADPPADGPRWQEAMSHAWSRVWRRFFGDAPAPRARRGALQHYTIAVLTGLAATRALEGPEARVREAELALLEDTLVRELSGPR
jgi:AcrR family transcriptional regulator